MEWLLKEKGDPDFGSRDWVVLESGAVEGMSTLHVPLHWHDAFELTVCLEGTGELQMEGKSYPYQKGDLIFVPCRLLHGYTETERGRYRVFFIRAERLLSRESSPADAELSAILFGETECVPVFSPGDPVYERASAALEGLQGASPLEQRAHLFYLFCALEGLGGKKRPRQSQRHLVQSAVEYVEEHFSEPVRLDDLSAHLGMSKYHFISVFRRYCGTTPTEYLISYRLRQAYRMLAEGKSITESAGACGFGNLSYFIRRFRDQYGMTPGRLAKVLFHSIPEEGQ